MKLRNDLVILVFLSGIMYFVSCKKDSDIPDHYCVGGNEGKITLTLQPEHHGEPIGAGTTYPDSAFIKYNTNEFPGDNPELYDLVVAGVPGTTEVVVNNLSCGSYFIYMTGFDVSIAERVKGGIPVTINYEDVSRDVKIPVTED